MGWIPYFDPIGALNGIYLWLLSLPNLWVETAINTVTLVLYPVYSVVDAIIFDIDAAWSPISNLINTIVLISNMPATFFDVAIHLPDEWTTLLLISIGISVSIRMYRWAKEIKGWIPTESGD